MCQRTVYRVTKPTITYFELYSIVYKGIESENLSNRIAI